MITSRQCPQRERKDRLTMDDLTGGTRREERVTGTPDTTIHDPDDTLGGAAGGGGSGTGERATGTPNTIYDLSSVLFHALEGGASYDTYIEDAEREGDGELADFFRRVRDEDSMRADEAQSLLAERTPTTTTTSATGGGVGGTSEGDTGGGASVGARGGSTSIEPVEGATAPSEGLAAGALRREETGEVGRADTDVGHRTEPSLAREGMEEAPPPRTSGVEEGVLPGREGRTEGTPPREGALTGGASPEDTSRRTEDEGPLGREGAGRPEGDREEDKGLLDKAKDAILGEEDEPRRREGSDRPGERR
jgi:hypothetical protein